MANKLPAAPLWRWGTKLLAIRNRMKRRPQGSETRAGGKPGGRSRTLQNYYVSKDFAEGENLAHSGVKVEVRHKRATPIAILRANPRAPPSCRLSSRSPPAGNGHSSDAGRLDSFHDRRRSAEQFMRPTERRERVTEWRIASPKVPRNPGAEARGEVAEHRRIHFIRFAAPSARKKRSKPHSERAAIRFWLERRSTTALLTPPNRSPELVKSFTSQPPPTRQFFLESRAATPLG